MNLTAKEKMVILAQQIIDGSMDIIDGCRRMTYLNIEEKIRNEDTDFLTLRGIESETDEFPIGEVRKHYHKRSLEKLDKELNEYIEQVRPTLLKACKNLISKYSN
jgi:hypothetical protein